MQPQAFQGGGIEAKIAAVLDDHLGHHRHHLAEHLAAFLDEQLVAGPDPLGRGAVQEAEIVADVVGELGLQPRAQDFPAAGRVFLALDDHGGRHVAEDEVAVAVAEVQVA